MPTNPYRPDFPNSMPIHGVRGKLLYTPPGGGQGANPTEYPVEQFSFNGAVESDDITNTSSNGARIRLDGIEEATGTITFVLDSFNLPTLAFLKPRTFVYLQLEPDGVSAYKFYALIKNHQWSSGPKAGTVRCTSDYESSGPIDYPDANLTTALPPLNASS